MAAKVRKAIIQLHDKSVYGNLQQEQQQKPQKIIGIVLSKEEDDTINSINNN